MRNVEAIDEVDLHHAQSIVAQHVSALSELAEDRMKHGYLQGVLDAAAIEAEDRAAAG